MDVRVLSLLENIPKKERVKSYLSLVPFVHFLEERLTIGDSVRSTFFEYSLSVIKDKEGWDKEIPLNNLNELKEALELVYFTFTTPVQSEGKDAWALCQPFTWTAFFGSQAFYDLLSTPSGELKREFINSNEFIKTAEDRIKIIYDFILERLYKYSFNFKHEIIHNHHDPRTRLTKYYKLEFDTRFVDLSFEGKLPELDYEAFRSNQLEDPKNLKIIQKILPLDKFTFRGFSIVRIIDVTTDYVIDKIKSNIVSLASGRKIREDIAYYLKTLMDDNDIDIHLFPIQRLNNQLTSGVLENLENILVYRCERYHLDAQAYKTAILNYLENPIILFYPDLDKVQNNEPPIMDFLRKICMQSLAVIPILFQNRLVGVLEVFSREKNRVNPQKLGVLSSIIPLLEQLLKTVIDNFNQTIDNVIKDKFTSLQPSVQWRFNEAAWHFLEKKQNDPKAEIEHISFPEVYPFYGAIDVRNSTVQRNEALKEDVTIRLKALRHLFSIARKKIQMQLLEELSFKTENWYKVIKKTIDSEVEFQLSLFLEKEIEPFLIFLKENGGCPEELIDQYFEGSRNNGAFSINRQELESSLQLLNQTIGNELDEFNKKVQEIYPSYFEKFRTDGMEYNVYIGQSITPTRRFDLLYLRNLRLLQLSSMAKIARRAKELSPALAKPLETTQLIFVHPNTIEISFRNDERRFDVEGMYNIRYEMIKKRIDKVHIKDSTERLTQPGKIAIVYFQKRDIENYLSFADYLQKQDILGDKIEFLQLEDLQGLKGLRAIRFTVVL